MRKRFISIIFAICLAVSTASAASAADAIDAGMMSLSDRGIAFIKEREGFSPKAYMKSTKWYIGYGTSCAAGEYPGGISEAEAEKLFLDEALSDAVSVNSFLSGSRVEVTQNQFDALVSFTYNLGTSWTDPSNRICSYLLQGLAHFSDIEIVNAIGTWCHSGKTVNDKLITRRLAEADLFLYGNYTVDNSHKYPYIVFDAGKGSVEHDICFYDYGHPYGMLPEAKLAGTVFDGWFSSGGNRVSGDDLAVANVTLSARWPGRVPDAQGISFPDVTAGDWFYHYVKDLSSSNIIKGYLDGTFKPNNMVSCAEALKLVLLAAGCNEQPPMNSNWAGGYLNLAVNEGWVNLAEITDLNRTISRQLMAKIAAGALGLGNTSKQSPFTDTTDKYVLALYDRGIVQGSIVNGSLCYMPDSNITRLELSAIVWRIMNMNPETEPGTATDPIETPENHDGQMPYGSTWLDIQKNVPISTYDRNSFAVTNGLMRYNLPGVMTKNGIDVSSFQGTIDWQKVSAAGIDFAIIRLGYRGYGTGSMNLDSCFISNIQGALNAGLNVGVYFFSQAITVEEAIEEADYVLSNIGGYNITYPVVFDWETIGNDSARTDGLATETLCQCAQAFCGRIAEAGYNPMIYFTSNLGYVRYDLSKIVGNKFWFAQYTDAPNLYYDFQMWQYSSSGTVDGIQGKVDMNIEFIK